MDQLDNIYPTALSQTTRLQRCPTPFIFRTSKRNVNSFIDIFCLDSCCLPCPAHFNLYPSLEEAYLASYILRIIAMSFALFTCITFAIRRSDKYPLSMVKYGTLSLTLTMLCGLFAFIGSEGPKSLYCADETTPSTGSNNILCFLQGILGIFTMHAVCLWNLFFILNAHVKIVWGISARRFYPLMQFLAWGLPIAFSIATALLQGIRFQLTPFCKVSKDRVYSLYLAPLVVYVIPSFLMHIATLLKMGLLYYNVRKLVRDNIEIPTILTEQEESQVRLRHQSLKLCRKSVSLEAISPVSVKFPQDGKVSPQDNNIMLNNSKDTVDSTGWEKLQLQGSIWHYVLMTNWRFVVIGANFLLVVLYSLISIGKFTEGFVHLTPYLRTVWLPCVFQAAKHNNNLTQALNTCLPLVQDKLPPAINFIGQEYVYAMTPLIIFIVFYRKMEVVKTWRSFWISIIRRFNLRS